MPKTQPPQKASLQKPFAMDASHALKTIKTLRAVPPKSLVQHPLTLHAKRVYVLTQAVPAGSVTTYGAMAKVLGSHPRAVGQALRSNPFAPTVPCHRVVAANGVAGGFCGHTEGQKMVDKYNLLKGEGVKFSSSETDWLVDQKCILDEKALEAAVVKFAEENNQ